MEKLRQVLHELADFNQAHHLHPTINEAVDELTHAGQKQPVAEAVAAIGAALDEPPPVDYAATPAPAIDTSISLVPEGFEEVPGSPGLFRRVG